MSSSVALIRKCCHIKNFAAFIGNTYRLKTLVCCPAQKVPTPPPSFVAPIVPDIKESPRKSSLFGRKNKPQVPAPQLPPPQLPIPEQASKCVPLLHKEHHQPSGN